MAADRFDLDGRVALVTGSTQGLGEASARVLAQHGARVIICSRKAADCERVAEEFRGKGLRAEGFACNIGREEQILAIYDYIDKQHGRLDILVNNAVLSPWRSIADTDRALMMKALETNIGGYWYMSTGAVALMKRNGGGSIINVSSIVAIRPTPMLALYSTFKASLEGMSKSFALEYGADGIRVNTIIPGYFATPLAEVYSPEQRERIIARTPLGRIGDPAEIGYATLFLASDASSFITGTSLVVDGGRLIGE